MTAEPPGNLGRRSFLAGMVGAAASSTTALAKPNEGVQRILEIVTTEEKRLYYEFAVEGRVEGTKTSDTVVGGTGNDAIVSAAGPNLTVVRGFSGNPGYGDAYAVEGEIVYFARTGGSSDFDLRLDGRSVSVDELNSRPDPTVPSPSTDIGRFIDGTLEIVTTEEKRLYYDFTVRGSVEGTKTSDTVVGGTGNDAIVSAAGPNLTVVRGFSGNPGYGDAYAVDGELVSFRRAGGSSDFFFRVDGRRFTLEELASEDGGGSGGNGLRSGGVPQYQGGSANTGYVPDACPPVSGHRLAWEVDLNEADARGLEISLTATDETVCAFIDNLEEGQIVLCLDPSSGDVRWKWEAAASRSFAFGRSGGSLHPYPSIAGDTVYCGLGEPEDGEDEAVHGVVVALDAADGTLEWEVGVGRGPAYVTVDSDTVYAGSRGALYALETSGEDTRWSVTPDDSGAYVSYPAVEGERVFFTTDGGSTYAVDRADGEILWRANPGALPPPSVADGTVYVARGGYNKGREGVRALATSDGSEAWRCDGCGHVNHAPAVGDDHVFVHDTSGSILYALDRRSGDVVWQFEIDVFEWNAPLLANDTVLFVGHSPAHPRRRLFMLDAATGEVVGTHEVIDEAGTSNPVVVGRTLYIAQGNMGQRISAFSGDTRC
jgi:outer membrane protein assembly factor BamB